MIGLQHRYPSADWEPGGSYGGNQTRSAKPRIRRCGCGAIAMTDLLLYVTRHRGWHAPALVQEAAACSTVPAAVYDRCCRRLQRTYLPMLPDFIRGIINLRGQMMPILDIRKRLGKEPKEDGLIIVLNIEGTPMGILVDAVDQMTDIPKDGILPMPARSTQRLVNGMCTIPDGSGTMLVLDCEQLLNHG